ncbi:MAG TPA: GlcNAc-transferase family protein, partial [Acidisarcina sp.]
LRPVSMAGWRKRTSPMRARFIGAGFVFAPGRFVEEVPYDPELYFYGEESTMTLRAFTHGYDLFHPHVPLVWHDYIRDSATRHWDNHTPDTEGTFDWSEFDSRSKEKVRRLLAGEPVGEYGLGTVRSLQDYETYAGISLSKRKAQDYTRQAAEPPNPPAAEDWADSIYEWMARITLDFLSLPVGALADPRCWYVTITDRDHQEIYRREIQASELATLSGQEDKIILICEFQSGTIPERWTVQPLSRSAGWLRKLADDFPDGEYTILVADERDGD